MTEDAKKEKTYKVFVNGVEKTVDHDVLTYDEAVRLHEIGERFAVVEPNHAGDALSGACAKPPVQSPRRERCDLAIRIGRQELRGCAHGLNLIWSR